MCHRYSPAVLDVHASLQSRVLQINTFKPEPSWNRTRHGTPWNSQDVLSRNWDLALPASKLEQLKPLGFQGDMLKILMKSILSRDAPENGKTMAACATAQEYASTFGTRAVVLGACSPDPLQQAVWIHVWFQTEGCRDLRVSFFLRSLGFDSIEAFYFAVDLSHPSGA